MSFMNSTASSYPFDATYSLIVFRYSSRLEYTNSFVSSSSFSSSLKNAPVYFFISASSSMYSLMSISDFYTVGEESMFDLHVLFRSSHWVFSSMNLFREFWRASRSALSF